jgi:genome maintenance exonuclease 1
VLSAYGKKGISEWRARVGEEVANKISGAAARRGTALHTVCEKYLLNELSESTMMPTTKQLFMQLKPHLLKNLGKIYCLEQSLYSHHLKIAGRVDCIAEWKGKLSVIDFKTSSKKKDKNYIKNYFMQCSAYATMFTELTGKHIEDIVVMIATEEEMQPSIFEENKHNYFSELVQYIDNYGKSLSVSHLQASQCVI